MRITLILITGLFVFTACTAQKLPNDPELSQLEDRLKELIDLHHAAGAAVAIIQDNELRYAKGFGYADYHLKKPVDANTIFGIGSVTKAFTASILGILEEQNQLSLQDKPSVHLPELVFYNKEMNANIQIHHLLNHGTGISNLSSESSAILFQSKNQNDLIPRLKHLRPVASVGERLEYNNYIYTIAALVGERASGSTWGENLKQLIFAPSGMNRTFASVEEANLQPNFSLGYALDSITPTPVMPERILTRAPAGDIYSSVNDMAKWLSIWMNQGKADGKKVLPESYVKKASESNFPWPSNPNDTTANTTYYGYGWLISNDEGLKRVEHSGGVSGYSSNVVFFPEKKLGIVVLTNQTTSSLSYAITNLYLNHILGRPENEEINIRHSSIHDLSSAKSPTITNEEAPPELELKAYTGTFFHPGFGQIKIKLDGQTLYAEFPLTKFRLEYSGDGIFRDSFTEEIPLVMWSFLRFQFPVNDEGLVESLALNIDHEAVIFEKITN